MADNKGFVLEVIGLIVVVILAFVEYLKPGNEVSFWLLLTIAIFVVIFIIYVYVKQKIEALDEIKQRVDTIEQTLNFKSDMHELDKRLSLLEKPQEKNAKR